MISWNVSWNVSEVCFSLQFWSHLIGISAQMLVSLPESPVPKKNAACSTTSWRVEFPCTKSIQIHCIEKALIKDNCLGVLVLGRPLSLLARFHWNCYWSSRLRILKCSHGHDPPVDRLLTWKVRQFMSSRLKFLKVNQPNSHETLQFLDQSVLLKG